MGRSRPEREKVRNGFLKLRAQRSGHAKGREPDRFVFTVPAHIARVLPRDQLYECQLRDEGVLFAPVSTLDVPEPVPPAWTRQ